MNGNEVSWSLSFVFFKRCVCNFVHEVGKYPELFFKKEKADPHPSQRILCREPFFILVQKNFKFGESIFTGQDIYTYAFHICLK